MTDHDPRRGELAPRRNHPARRGERDPVSEAKEIVDALEVMPEDRRGELTQILVSREYHSGPIPSPRTLAGYEVIAPGSAQKMIDMADRQQRHDHAFEDKVLASETLYRLITFIGAIVVLVALIAASAFCAYIHEKDVAIALGAASALTVFAGVLIKGRDLMLKPVVEQPKVPRRPVNKRPSKLKPKR